MSEIRYEDSAREIARSVMGRYNLRIPRELLPQISEMMAEAAHDGAEFGEAMAAADEGPSGLEHYTLGYIHGLGDYERGLRQEEGEV